MHIQTTPGAETTCKIWLEEKGVWSISKSGDVPTKVFRVVEEALQTDPGLAWRIRAQWVRQMIVKDWLAVRLAGNQAKLVAYPGTNHEFTRDVDVSKHAPVSFYASPDDISLDPETASLALGVRRPEHERVLIDVANTLWTQTPA
jgi:hypothetical protein